MKNKRNDHVSVMSSFTENFTILGSNAQKAEYLPEFEIAVH